MDETVRGQRSANEINCYFVTLPIDLGTYMHQIETIWLEVHHMMCNVTSGSSQVDLTSTLHTNKPQGSIQSVLIQRCSHKSCMEDFTNKRYSFLCLNQSCTNHVSSMWSADCCVLCPQAIYELKKKSQLQGKFNLVRTFQRG